MRICYEYKGVSDINIIIKVYANIAGSSMYFKKLCVSLTVLYSLFHGYSDQLKGQGKLSQMWDNINYCIVLNHDVFKHK